MDRETYVAPIVEAYIPHANRAEQLALTAELLDLFDGLFALASLSERFDSIPTDMVESDSREKLISAPNP